MRIPRIVPPAILALLLVIALLAVAQNSAPSLEPPASAGGPPQRHGDPEEDKVRDRMLKDAEKEWNKQRQAALKKDTDKLLEMATQLKQQVDKSNENILSLEVIKKADEIEKLARSVREKMKAHSY